MTDICIDRCTVRLVRRTGWSWGPDPRRLADDAVRILPALLEKALEGCFESEEEHFFEAPIGVRISVSTEDLNLTLSPINLGPKPATAASVTRTLEKKVKAALLPALGLVEKSTEESLKPARTASCRFRESKLAGVSSFPQGHALSRLLVSLGEEGTLEPFLARFTLPELEAWHARVRPQFAQSEERSFEATRYEDSRFGTVPRALHCRTVADRAQLLRQRLMLATMTAGARKCGLADREVWAAVDEQLPLDAIDSSPSTTRRPTSPEEFGADKVHGHPSPAIPGALSHGFVTAAPVPRCSQGTWNTRISSALPFLLLGPLAQLGYLSLLTATLEGACLEDQAALFAASFAYKLMEPSARGWQRSESQKHVAATFSGMEEDPPDGVLCDFARKIVPYLGPLDRFLADAVAAGRLPDAPVLLMRADSAWASGFLLCDVIGCFPIAVLPDGDSVVSTLRSIRPRVLLVSPEAAGPRLLKELNSGQIPFVTNVPPVRGEPWQAVQRGVLRLGWTNHPSPEEEFLCRGAVELESTCEETAALWKELGLLRLAIPRTPFGKFERTLFHAASLALGTLSWRLWSDRGRTCPQLALERLGDLEAQVRFSEESVAVLLPLGRRHSELQEAGLLRSVTGISWLGNRRLEFGWG